MKKYVAVTLVGDTPLLFNRQPAKAPSKDIEPKEVAKLKLHVDEKGKPCVPKLLLIRGFISGGRYVQYSGKQKFTSGKPPSLSSLVTSVIDVVEDYCSISPATWEVDQQPFNAHGGKTVTRPAEGAIRPRFPRGWRVSFTLEYDTDDPKVTEEKVREIVGTTGKKIGLGSYRVENTGWYGKFTVETWEHVKLPASKKAA